MKKILFVDNEEKSLRRFMQLPFAEEHAEEVEFVRSPVGLKDQIAKHPDLRLIILDLMWDEGKDPILLGMDAMQELKDAAADIPVVIYSALDDETGYDLRTLIPKAMGLGAYDW